MRLRGTYEFVTDEERIKTLAQLIEEGSESPVVRQHTMELLNRKGIKSYDHKGEIKAIFEWVRDNITYRRHVICRDSFTTAERVLQLGAGDCDNMVVLVNSMLGSVGLPFGMRIISSSHDKSYHHIYSLAGLPPHNPTQWIPLDATEKLAFVGWEPKYAKKRDFVVKCAG